MDFILPVLFFRVARNTYNRRKEESAPLLESDPIEPSAIAPQSQLNCLLIAATVHLIGNIANVVGNNLDIPYVVFILDSSHS